MARPLSMSLLPVKPLMRITTVVKHAVQHQAHAVFLSIFTQAQKGVIAAELHVYVAIILSIVFMYARRGEDRIEIQRGDTQLFQVRQVFANPIQIAAIKCRSAGISTERFIPIAQNDVAFCRMVIINLILLWRALLTTRKTIGENLIEDLILYPLRAVIRKIDRKLLKSCRRN